jgi:pimeloyl-ACP methyl ester carboxylesterase
MTALLRLAAACLVASPFAHAVAAPAAARQSLFFPAGRSIGFPQATAWEYSIHVDSWAAASCAPHGRDVFVVHGFGDNGGLFEPLAGALVESGKACRVLAIDLPAHGESTVSTDPAFGPRVVGELGVADYAAVVDDVLTEIEAANIPVDTIVGHSTGGLIVQRLQASYARTGASLRTKFGIERTILIASDLPRALTWATGDAPIQAGLAKGLVVNLAQTSPPPEGTRVVLDYATYLALKFSVNGVPVASSPSLAIAASINDPEPYAAAANIVGLGPTGQTTNTVPRLSIPPNLWGAEPLTVIWPDKDAFFLHAEMDALANYLKPGTQAIVVSDAEAVHAIAYTKPALLLPYF